MDNWGIWLAIACGGGFAAVAPVFLRPILTTAGVIDIPNERSSHTLPTLRGCGLAQLLGALIGAGGIVWAVGWGSDGSIVAVVTSGAAVLSLVGLLDDVRGERGLGRGFRFGAQIIIGTMVTIVGVGLFHRPWWFIPIGAMLVAGYVNSTNFMDGINGISGFHGLVVGATYAFVGALTGQLWMLAVGGLTAVIFVVFLPWNLTKPGAFLGDVGSYLLGALVAGVAVVAWCAGVAWSALLGPLVIYLVDTIATAGHRLVRGRNVFDAHREHVYQRLVANGVRHNVTAVAVAAMSLCTAAIGLLFARRVLSIGLGAGLVLCVSMVYLGLPRIWSLRKRAA